MKRIFLIGAACAVALCSCHHAHEAAEEHHEHEGHEEHGEEIILPQAKARLMGVKAETLKGGPFHEVIKAGGQILPTQSGEAVAVATMAGIVSLSGTLAEGTSVSRGKTLLTLTAKTLQNGDPIDLARATLERSKGEYERLSKLVGDKIVSQRDYAAAKEEYERASLAWQALSQHRSEKGQQIVSPISGYVEQVLVREGDYVETGQPLVRVVQNNRLTLRAQVPERHFSALPSIRTAYFRTAAGEKVYKLSELKGRILSYGHALGEGSFYVPITFELNSAPGIVPGSFVEVFLLSNERNGVLSLPHEAITEEGGLHFAYLQLDEEGYKKQEVTLGQDNGERVQILSGLKEGDRVVTRGAMHVRLAASGNAIPAHSHEH